MSQPTPYNRQFSFTNDQTANPSTKTPGNQLDAEFNAVLTTFAQVLANLALLQRDDGQLANASVGIAQMKAEVSTGVAPATAWASPQSYSVNAFVMFGTKLYRCLVQHISGTFATDLAAGKWLLVADFTSAIGSPGVNTIGGQQNAITVAGGVGTGSIPTADLPVVRYDETQTFNATQQLQVANNVLLVCAAGNQSLSGGQQVQAATNIAAPSGGGAQALSNAQILQICANIIALTGVAAQSLTSGQQLQLANNGLIPTAAGGQAFNTTQQTQIANNILVPTGAAAQSLTSGQALQARTNLLMSTEIGKIEQWPTSDVPAGRLKCDGTTKSRTTFADLFNYVVKSGAATFTNASTSVGMAAHGRSVGDPVKLFTTGTLPTNFTAGTHGLITVGTNYFIASVVDANTVTLSATAGGAAITAGSAGSGTHTWVSAPYGDGDGSTTFTVPDYRGYFLRGWDNGAGVDANHSLGVSQTDALQGHIHNLVAPAVQSGGSGGQPSTAGGFATVSATGSPVSDGSNGTPRVAAETRPKNFPVNFTIRYAA